MGIPAPGTPEADAWVAAGPESAPPPAMCPDCSGKGIAYVPKEDQDGIIRYGEDACPCPAGDFYRGLDPRQRRARYRAYRQLQHVLGVKPWCGVGVRNAGLDDFPAERTAVEKALAEHRGLYIWGPTGTGKTHMAAAILRHMAFRGDEVEGLNVAYWFADLRRAIGCGGKDGEPTIENLMERAIFSTILAIDDLGAQRLTEWNGERLYELIDARCCERDELLTIITSNLNTEDLTNELARDLGRTQAERLVSRISGMCSVDINLVGPDRRLS